MAQKSVSWFSGYDVLNLWGIHQFDLGNRKTVTDYQAAVGCESSGPGIGQITVTCGANRPHWHVDYLRLKGYIQEIWYGRGAYYDEHRWTARLRSMPHADVLVPGFGSSDCRCETHLVYFPLRPDINRFRREQPRAADAVARPPIYRWVTGI